MAGGRPFQKGQSGNPGGRPKAVLEVIEMARSHTADAIATLARIQGDEKAPPAARVSAATALLDRGWGKPTQPISGDGDRPPLAVVSVPTDPVEAARVYQQIMRDD